MKVGERKSGLFVLITTLPDKYSAHFILKEYCDKVVETAYSSNIPLGPFTQEKELLLYLFLALVFICFLQDQSLCLGKMVLQYPDSNLRCNLSWVGP